MNFKAFVIKNWQHFFVIAVIFIIAIVFYKPQVDGYGLRQHDTAAWKGMAQQTDIHRDLTGEEPLWTNAMYGGMPTTQISVYYPGNVFKEVYFGWFKMFPSPIGLLILHLIGFYILALFLRISPLIGLLGGVAFSFASYEIIIVQAGHFTKSVASAFLAPTLGALIYAYKNNRLWGIVLASVFMTFELIANHLQVTYYFAFLLAAVGIYFFIRAIKSKELKAFVITSAGLLAGFIVAVMINYGNVALTSDYAKHSVRGANDLTINSDGTKVKKAAGLSNADVTKWSYGIGETMTFFSPNVKGGGSFPLGGSQFEDIVLNSDFSGNEQRELLNTNQQNGAVVYAYWGEQPGTSGPVYLGVVVLLLALLGMVFLKGKMKWALFALTVLAVMLSWGKNFPVLTDMFIDYMPGYDKFRSITMILILAELTVALLGMMFLSQLLKQREEIKEKKKVFLSVIGGFALLMILIKFVGLGDGYASKVEREQVEASRTAMTEQLVAADPAAIMQNYGVDTRNQIEVDNFVDTRLGAYVNSRSIRADIFHSSMNRSIIFVLLAGGLLAAFVMTSLSPLMLTFGMLALTMIDVIPVAYDYIGDFDRYWVEKEKTTMPVATTNADAMVMESELAADSTLFAKVAEGKKRGEAKAEELEYEGSARKNLIDAHRYYALNMETNFRVFDFNGGYGNTNASFWHKSLGGFHAAKLRNIDNLINFHLAKMNEPVYDMMNVKYFLQQTQLTEEQQQQGVPTMLVANPRPSALGNAWLVQEVEAHANADDEIRALGNSFEIENMGSGKFIINAEVVKGKQKVYGAEKMQYLVAGKDTMDVQIRAGLKVGEEASFVMDTYGQTNLVPKATLVADTLNSFQELVTFKVLSDFNPRVEAVMLESEAKKLSTRKFSGKGLIEMTSYAPNKITYSAKVEGKQLAVFSEIYYADGWKAFVDGKETEILKANYLLRGLELGNGKHKVEFVYDVPKYHTSNTLAYIFSFILFIAIGGLLFMDYNKRKSGTELKAVEE